MRKMNRNTGKKTEKIRHCDVLVIGAGPAGIAAAIQSARAGSDCVLVEKNGMPGGAITAAGIASPGLFAVAGRQIIGGIGWELVTKTRRECGERTPDLSCWDPVFWKNEVPINPLVFAAVCEREMLAAGVDLRYHTMPATLSFKKNEWLAGLCAAKTRNDPGLRSGKAAACPGNPAGKTGTTIPATGSTGG